MSNKAFGRLWDDTDKFRSGLSYKEFYKNPSLSIEELLHNRSTVIASKKANNKLVLRASEIDWNGTPAVLLRGKAYDLEYDGTFPGRGGSTSSTAKTLAQGNSWTSSCRSWLSESVRSSRIPTKKNMSP